MRGLRALLLALACLGLMLVAVRAQAADPAAAMLANATAPAPAAADSHADHDHDHDHAHEAPAATQSPAAENGTAVTAAAAAADDHAHEEEGHDHAAEATAAGTDAHDHAGEEGGSHAGHSHGISVTDYCESGLQGLGVSLPCGPHDCQCSGPCTALAASICAAGRPTHLCRNLVLCSAACLASRPAAWAAEAAPRSSPARKPSPAPPLNHILPAPLLPAPAGAALAEGIDPCAYTELENYNLGLHIGSVFILLGVSLAGALLPVLLHISSKSSLVLTCVKMGTYFGAWPAGQGVALGAAGGYVHAGRAHQQFCTKSAQAHPLKSWGWAALGPPARESLIPVPASLPAHPIAGFGTILSTAFIHMLLPAAQNLSSPCLSEGWNEAYEAWAYMFVTVAIVFMQVGGLGGVLWCGSGCFTRGCGGMAGLAGRAATSRCRSQACTRLRCPPGLPRAAD